MLFGRKKVIKNPDSYISAIKHSPLYDESKQAGLSLVEVMVTMSILAVGFLGIEYGQMAAAHFFSQSISQNRAETDVEGMLGKIWGAGDSGLSSFNGVDTSNTGTWGSGPTSTAVSSWAAEVSLLPGGKGTVAIQSATANGGTCTTSPCIATVTVQWEGKSGLKTYSGSEYIVQPQS